jgi:hypothetical protein
MVLPPLLASPSPGSAAWRTCPAIPRSRLILKSRDNRAGTGNSAWRAREMGERQDERQPVPALVMGSGLEVMAETGAGKVTAAPFGD